MQRNLGRLENMIGYIPITPSSSGGLLEALAGSVKRCEDSGLLFQIGRSR